MTISLAQVLGQPVVVDGQEVIIIQDIIGQVPVTEQHEYVEIAKATNTSASIQMREADIELARDRYPKRPVYGLWQVLMASGLVDVSAKLQVLAVNDYDGFYVHADTGRVLYSGNYDAGFFAADAGFKLSNAIPIVPELANLQLPPNSALLAREILAERRKVLRDGVFKFLAAAIAIIFVGFVTDFGLQIFSERDYVLIVEKDEKLKKMTSDLRSLSKNRLVSTPNQGVEIHRLALLFHDFEDLEFDTTIQFQKKRLKVSFASEQNPTELYDFMTAQIRPDGRWNVLMDLRGAR